MHVKTMIDWIQKCGKPIAVDLDHTLLQGNTTWFLLSDLIKQRRVQEFRGRSWPQFKFFLAQQGRLDVAALPYRQKLLSFLRQVGAVCPLYLVTGTHQRVALQIAEHLGIFEEAIGSCHQKTLIHQHKADYLVRRWGRENFLYIGDSWKDLPVWKSCLQGMAVPSSLALSLYLRWQPVGKRKVWILPFR